MDMRVDQGESDEALASAAAGGDRAAFALLVGRHYDFVFRIAWRWLGRREEAEDLTQDVCVRLGRAIASFRGEAAFSTWLYQLTLNALRDRQRAASRQRRGEQALFAQALVEPAHAEPAPDDAGETLWAAVRQLPEKTRDAVLLVYAEEQSHAEAARILGCSESTVSWHVHDARKRLRHLLAAGDAA